MSQPALTESIRIFDRQGVELAKFRASVQRSWAIGIEGRASFTYATRKTNVVNEKVLQFGNYLLIENSRLPAWVGVIDLPRSWTDKEVEVNAYSPERLFQYRRGPFEQKLTGSAGSIFRDMVNYINGQEQTVMRAGNIWGGGTSREETINPNTLEVNLKQLQERSKEEYYFEPQIEGGRLIIYANWYQKLGEAVACNLWSVKKGGNMEAPTMTEDDEILNSILGYGDGITWASRPVRYAVDIDSIDKYGLRQTSRNYNGVSQVGTLDANNAESLAETTKPRKIFQLTALNIGETFDYIKLGNSLQLQIDNLGFYQDGAGTVANVRILGMTYDPKAGNKIKLVTVENV